MSLKKAGIGLAITAALLVAAVGASAASAASITVHKCEVATGTGTSYTSGTCTTEGAGGFQKVPFTTTEGVEVANASAFELKTTNGGVNFVIKCTGLEGSGTATDAGEQINGSGITLTYTGCTVTAPAGKGCKVQAGPTAEKITTNTLKSTTTRSEAGNFKTTYLPASGETFVTIAVSGCSTAALNGNKEVTGSASTTESTDTMKQTFTESSSNLKFGGQSAKLIGSSEQKMGTAFISVGP